MKVWILTYDDGDYYPHIELQGIFATQESAQAEGLRLAKARREYDIKWRKYAAELEVGEWSTKDDLSELQYYVETWYVSPEEVQP